MSALPYAPQKFLLLSSKNPPIKPEYNLSNYLMTLQGLFLPICHGTLNYSQQPPTHLIGFSCTPHRDNPKHLREPSLQNSQCTPYSSQRVLPTCHRGPSIQCLCFFSMHLREWSLLTSEVSHYTTHLALSFHFIAPFIYT